MQMFHSDLRYKGIGSIDHFYHNMFDFPYNFGKKEAEFEQESISQLSLNKTWIPIQGTHQDGVELRNWSAKEDSWPRSTLLFFSLLSSSSSSWLTRSGLRALEVFTPGFLLVDDEVIGVRVESADDGYLYEIDDKDDVEEDETCDVDIIDDRIEDDFESTFEGPPPSFQVFAGSWQELNL